MPPAVDERGLVLLRRKLEALNYTEPLDAGSAGLVNHLVNDLIRTTDSYRSIKLQAAQYAQEVATFNTKVSTTSMVGMQQQQQHGMKCLEEAMLVKITLCSLPQEEAHSSSFVFAVQHTARQPAVHVQHICRLPLPKKPQPSFLP